jgi:hypothetical protein
MRCRRRPPPANWPQEKSGGAVPAQESGSLGMSERAIGFVENWVTENIDAKSRQVDGFDLPAKELAARCLIAAKAQGISQSEIDDAFEDLTAFMAGQIEEAKDREKDREQDREEETPLAPTDD